MSIESTSPSARAYSRIKSFCEEYDVSRSTAYRLAAAGHIRFVKLGEATLVDLASARAYFASLPEAKLSSAA
jgi:excisionase family DNA binding protein